jgi:dephospho-CoA kinase
MIIIGLTGVIGSGKSSAARLLRKRGLNVIDLDALAKDSLSWEETRNEIQKVFGEEVISNGKVDAEKLSNIVFHGNNALRTLESIVHPRVRAEVDRQMVELRERGVPVVVLDHPLLFETGVNLLVDRIVVVTAGEEKILERLKERGVKPDEARRRLSFQIPLGEKEARADYVIDNNGTEEELEKNIESLLGTIMEWEEKGNAS